MERNTSGQQNCFDYVDALTRNLLKDHLQLERTNVKTSFKRLLPPTGETERARTSSQDKGGGRRNKLKKCDEKVAILARTGMQ